MAPTVPGRNLNLLDYWRIVCGYKRMIAGLVVASVLVAGIVSKLSPKLYEAKATILPVREEAMVGGLSFGGGGGKDKGGGGASMAMEALGGKGSGANPIDILSTILGSRTMAEAVVDQLNLTQYYGTESEPDAVRAVRSEMTFKATQYKAIDITVEGKDPKMAADIANAYASNLDRLNKELTITSSKRNRLFIEARLREKTKALADAEEALKTFQTEHRTMEITAQAEAAMDAVVGLHGQIVALEVELAALKEYATPDHPMINQLQAQIQELRQQLDKLEQDQASGLGAKRRARQPFSRKVFPAFEEAPGLALELLRLTRQMKVEEAVYGMLVGMLEQAKIAEARDLPTIHVVDVAVPPLFKSKPKTLQHVQVAGALSLVLGLLLAFFLNYLEQLRAQEAAAVRRADKAGELAEVDFNDNGDKAEVRPGSPKETERLHG